MKPGGYGYEFLIVRVRISIRGLYADGRVITLPDPLPSLFLALPCVSARYIMSAFPAARLHESLVRGFDSFGVRGCRVAGTRAAAEIQTRDRTGIRTRAAVGIRTRD
jgi:hypothetical protein